MRIITFNNMGTGHILNNKSTHTVCGREWPGAQGEVEIREPQYADSSIGGKVHLCGNCEKVIDKQGYVG